jgi:hypothetical protein
MCNKTSQPFIHVIFLLNKWFILTNMVVLQKIFLCHPNYLCLDENTQFKHSILLQTCFISSIHHLSWILNAFVKWTYTLKNVWKNLWIL